MKAIKYAIQALMILTPIVLNLSVILFYLPKNQIVAIWLLALMVISTVKLFQYCTEFGKWFDSNLK